MRRSPLVQVSPNGYWVDASEPVSLRLTDDGAAVVVENVGVTYTLTPTVDSNVTAMGLASLIARLINEARGGEDGPKDPEGC